MTEFCKVKSKGLKRIHFLPFEYYYYLFLNFRQKQKNKNKYVKPWFNAKNADSENSAIFVQFGQHNSSYTPTKWKKTLPYFDLSFERVINRLCTISKVKKTLVRCKRTMVWLKSITNVTWPVFIKHLFKKKAVQIRVQLLEFFFRWNVTPRYLKGKFELKCLIHITHSN